MASVKNFVLTKPVHLPFRWQYSSNVVNGAPSPGMRTLMTPLLTLIPVASAVAAAAESGAALSAERTASEPLTGKFWKLRAYPKTLRNVMIAQARCSIAR